MATFRDSGMLLSDWIKINHGTPKPTKIINPVPSKETQDTKELIISIDNSLRKCPQTLPPEHVRKMRLNGHGWNNENHSKNQKIDIDSSIYYINSFDKSKPNQNYWYERTRNEDFVKNQKLKFQTTSQKHSLTTNGTNYHGVSSQKQNSMTKDVFKNNTEMKSTEIQDEQKTGNQKISQKDNINLSELYNKSMITKSSQNVNEHGTTYHGVSSQRQNLSTRDYFKNSTEKKFSQTQEESQQIANLYGTNYHGVSSQKHNLGLNETHDKSMIINSSQILNEDGTICYGASSQQKNVSAKDDLKSTIETKSLQKQKEQKNINQKILQRNNPIQDETYNDSMQIKSLQGPTEHGLSNNGASLSKQNLSTKDTFKKVLETKTTQTQEEKIINQKSSQNQLFVLPDICDKMVQRKVPKFSDAQVSTIEGYSDSDSVQDLRNQKYWKNLEKQIIEQDQIELEKSVTENHQKYNKVNQNKNIDRKWKEEKLARVNNKKPMNSEKERKNEEKRNIKRKGNLNQIDDELKIRLQNFLNSSKTEIIQPPTSSLKKMNKLIEELDKIVDTNLNILRSNEDDNDDFNDNNELLNKIFCDDFQNDVDKFLHSNDYGNSLSDRCKILTD